MAVFCIKPILLIFSFLCSIIAESLSPVRWFLAFFLFPSIPLLGFNDRMDGFSCPLKNFSFTLKKLLNACNNLHFQAGDVYFQVGNVYF